MLSPSAVGTMWKFANLQIATGLSPSARGNDAQIKMQICVLKLACHMRAWVGLVQKVKDLLTVSLPRVSVGRSIVV